MEITNAQKAARLEEMAANREADSRGLRGLHDLAKKLGLPEPQKQKAVAIAMADADAALLRECAGMMRERGVSEVQWDTEGGATKNGLYLWAGPVLNGFVCLVLKQQKRLHMDWHPTLKAAQAAAVAWVDEQEDATDLKGLDNYD